MTPFRLETAFTPRGDQPQAIEALTRGVLAGLPHQVLLGVTGSGKTFTIAGVIEQVQRPTIVIAHNKTLTAQLYGELRELFPDNAVEFFVSFYDYYQPEAYLPASNTFIEKDSLINDDIERLRHSATRAVLERPDTIIVASVSCIYGIGSPEDYRSMHLTVEAGPWAGGRDAFLARLVAMQYERGNELKRGEFRVRGDVVEVYPSNALDRAIRVEFFGDDVDRIAEFDQLTGKTLRTLSSYGLFPNSHWITPGKRLKPAMKTIEAEMKARVEHFLRQGQIVEADRIEQRTRFDMEMLKEFGHCHGIENYSRHLAGRAPGERPSCLLDYFADEFLVVIDESHATVPQIGGMYNGDRARKGTLVDYGFRLPSALDNRPLMFEEFAAMAKQRIYVSATPGEYEREHAGPHVVEQIVRPTGLLDPKMVMRPTATQVDDLLHEIRQRTALRERVLVTTLTKKMAEDLTEHYTELGVKARYLHSDIDTLERVEILRGLREGTFDVLVGVNLLREGLDLPEVSLVAILDADKEGFLRSERSIIQTAGRAARNLNGLVILYADKVTGSMQRAMDETERRRAIQHEYNVEHGITPESVRSSIKDVLAAIYDGGRAAETGAVTEKSSADAMAAITADDIRGANLANLEREMREAAAELDFERAAGIRDRIKALKGAMLALGIS